MRIVTLQDIKEHSDLLFFDEDNKCAIFDGTSDINVVLQLPVDIVHKLNFIMVRDRKHDPFNFKVCKSMHLPRMREMRKELQGVFPNIDGDSWSFVYFRNCSNLDSHHRVVLRDKEDKMMMRLSYGL